MNGEATALLKVWSTVFISLCYCYFIVSKIPKGKFRLLSLVPIFCLYTILPLFLSYVFPAGITAFFITWLTNFKLLLFAFNLGPLTSHVDPARNRSRQGQDIRNLSPNKVENKFDHREPIKSFSRFVFIAAFPLNIKNPSSRNEKSAKVLPLNFWSEALISSILIAICDGYKGVLHPGVTYVIYCSLLYLLVDIIIGISNMLVGPIMGVELVSPSDEPYVSTSLQDFWGRRWNLMVTDTLRNTIYKPTRVFLSTYTRNQWAQSFAVLAAFIVSGLMHELIFFYVTRVSPSWEVTWFFVLQGLCVVVEVALKKALGQKLRLHWAVTAPLAVGFVMGTGYLWFFPPLVRNQGDLRAIEELKSSYDFIRGMFKWHS